MYPPVEVRSRDGHVIGGPPAQVAWSNMDLRRDPKDRKPSDPVTCSLEIIMTEYLAKVGDFLKTGVIRTADTISMPNRYAIYLRVSTLLSNDEFRKVLVRAAWVAAGWGEFKGRVNVLFRNKMNVSG